MNSPLFPHFPALIPQIAVQYPARFPQHILTCSIQCIQEALQATLLGIFSVGMPDFVVDEVKKMRSGKTIQREIVPILCCLLALLLSSCGSSAGTKSSRTNLAKAPISQQTYRYGDVATDISSFDPGQATDQPSLEAITMVFTGLVQLDDDLQVQPQLAQSYDISSDGLTYTFHLRPNLKFSDGQPLTATDVAYSIDRALSPAIANLNGVTLTYLGQLKDAPERVDNNIST